MRLSQKNKSIIQCCFLLLIIFLTGGFLAENINLKLLPHIINLVDKKFIVLLFVLIVFYILFEVFIISIIKNSVDNRKIKFISFKVATTGFYYNLVTPLASGSQPMQIYIFNKHNISFSKASAIITNKTIIFQCVVTIYSLFFVIFNSNYLKENIPEVIVFINTSLFINLFSILVGIFIVFSPEKMKNILGIILKVAKKFNLDNIYKRYEDMCLFIDNYSFYIKQFIINKRKFIISIILTFIQITIYFSISYFVYKSFNLSNLDYFEGIMLQSFLYMAVSSIPTPGNLGATEIAFLSIYKNIFPKEILGYSVFLYSFFVYYVILFLCGIATIITHYTICKRDSVVKTISS